MKKKKVLILGGEGFIGKNIRDFLSASYYCYSVDANQSIFEKKHKYFIKKNPYENKITNDFTAIIHLIDNPVVVDEFKKKENNLIKNVNLNSNNHLILFSSAVVYANPNSDYGKRKLALENIYIEYCKKNNIQMTIFRLFNIYGPYQIPNKQGSLVANLICNHLNGRKTEINDLNAKRDFMFSQDVGRFIKYVLEHKIIGIIDLATNHLISLKKLIKLLEKNVVKNKLEIIYKNARERSKCPPANNVLLKKIATTPIEIALKKTLSFYKNNVKIINKLTV